ncbi:AT-rich interactive domain-containing protein 5A [Coregonus clupeaformis]|uniref:AT-rich interactive domain-containing protein 5A n=1 Tax=Coregonus clupeaformis TaxID=59861 RepID=UPI001BE0D103|nr:AT-rich interactive domain-containing protein 5A [Coregonus clupeaformis]
MAQVQEERPSEQEKEMGEETFLKDLCLYMKKRGTPIERIPHLGFKQIDLFMMYKTVKSLGGYLQVTTQQLWKQVYNILGGNPRSTSAATCTRRHYEKLLLAYECHVKGDNYMEVLPQHQQKRLHYSSLCEEDECPRTAKRIMTYGDLQTSQQQNPHNVLIDSRVRIIPMHVHYRQNYHHPGNPVHPPLLPYVHPPLTPSSHPGPQPQPPYLPSPQGQIERTKQPLERLRLLANQYKCSSDWTEPLNLSRKRACVESGGHPASSFTPPPSNKSPKFLNMPSPLYPTKGMAKDEGCETPEGKSPPERSYLYPLETRDGYVIDLTSSSSSGGSSHSLTPASSPGMKTESLVPSPLQSRKASAPSMVHVPRPLKREYPDWPMEEWRGESPKHSPGPLNLSCALPSPPRETGRMEIQIPLVLLHDWIKGGLLCGPAGSRPGAPSLQGPTPQGPTLGQTPEPRERTWTRSDTSPTVVNHADQVFQSPHRDQDRSSGYLRERSLERYRNLPSPTTTSPASSHLYPMEPYQISCYKPQLSGSIIHNPACRDLYPWEKQENTRRPYHPNHMHPQDLRDRAQPIPLKIHPSSQALEQDYVGPTSPAYSLDTSQGREDNPRMALMVDPSSSSLVPLTPEEFMKLKRLISSSL